MSISDTSAVIEAVGRNLEKMRDDFRDELRTRDQRGNLAMKALDNRISATKEIAISAARGKGKASDGLDPAGLIRMLAAATRAKIARMSLDDFLAANPDPVAGRFRTLIAEGKAMQFKAVTNPAMTTVSGWAGELVGPKTVAPLASIAVSSAYGQLSARPSVIPLSFDGTDSIYLPSRAVGDLAGGFHGEGQPLQVKKGSLSSTAIQPYSFGSISTFTREMARASNFEQILRTEISADSTLAIDAVFLGDDAGTAIQPPGLLYGATSIPPSAATPAQSAAAEDLANLAAAIPNAADLVFVSTAEVRARALIYGGPGISSLSWITSPAAPADSVVALDAASLGMAEGGFDYSISEAAEIHEDDNPLPISTGTSGAGAITAAPVRSLWQTAVIGIRIVALTSWGMRGPGTRVAIIANIAW